MNNTVAAAILAAESCLHLVPAAHQAVAVAAIEAARAGARKAAAAANLAALDVAEETGDQALAAAAYAAEAAVFAPDEIECRGASQRAVRCAAKALAV